jgi:hypothetical protein
MSFLGDSMAKTTSKGTKTTKPAAPKTPAKPARGAAKKPAPITKKVEKKPMPKSPPPAKPVAVAPAVRSRPAVNAPGSTIVPPDYKPRDKEEFMNPVMREYFRLKLVKWKAELVREAEGTVQDTLRGTELQKPDLVDRASEETDHALELRTRDRERKLDDQK